MFLFKKLTFYIRGSNICYFLLKAEGKHNSTEINSNYIIIFLRNFLFYEQPWIIN